MCFFLPLRIVHACQENRPSKDDDREEEQETKDPELDETYEIQLVWGSKSDLSKAVDNRFDD